MARGALAPLIKKGVIHMFLSSILALFLLALIMGGAAYYYEKKNPVSTSVCKSQNSVSVQFDSNLLREFQNIFGSINHEQFELANVLLVAETAYVTNDTFFYRFSCLKRSLGVEIDEHKLTALRKHLNKVINSKNMILENDLRNCTDPREYQNIINRNFCLCWGFAIDNVFQTDDSVFFELYKLDTPQNAERFKNLGY